MQAVSLPRKGQRGGKDTRKYDYRRRNFSFVSTSKVSLARDSCEVLEASRVRPEKAFGIAFWEYQTPK